MKKNLKNIFTYKTSARVISSREHATPTHIRRLVGMHEYSTRRVWTVSNYFFELESNTRYLELFNIIRTTCIPSNCSDQMNYSDVIELLDLVELFEPDRTVRPTSDYSVLANCSNQVGLFDLCRIIWSIFLPYLFIYLTLAKINFYSMK